MNAEMNNDTASTTKLMDAYTHPLKPAERKILGRNDEIKKVLAGLMRPELCNVLLLGEPGAGKAHPNDTLLPVVDERGFARIDELKIGDLVFDEKGFPTCVVGIFPQGKREVYKVTFKDGTSVLCNDEHLWNVRTKDDSKKDKAFKTMTLKEIMSSNPTGNDEPHWFIPKNAAVFRKEKDLPLDPYEFGEQIMQLQKYAIPRIYLEASIEQRKALLDGILSYDEEPTSHIKIHTENKQLLSDIKELMWSLGIRDAKYEDNEISLSAFISDMKDIGITSIEDLGYETEMTCIMVNGESHLYQVGREHIVTHNTALVQAVMLIDKNSDYLEVDLSKMIADCQTDVNEMAAKLKGLFDEVEAQIKHSGKNTVLFIDEFHQIVQLSPAAVEALKPLLADSGTRGIKVIAATTYREFREYISANQPLVERLQRVNVAEPSKEVVMSILRGMAKRYGVEEQFKDDELFEMIYELTNQYIPANAQPRKSILILDAMIGWFRAFQRPLDKKLLEDVFMQAENVAVSTQVDATNIASTLRKKVLAQEFAVNVIEQRLHIAIADMGDDTKPKASFLFTGSTGVGKTEMTKQMAKLLFNDERRLIRFDMSEYANSDSMERFRRELTSQIWTRPYSIVLLDEIEKACAEVTRLLLGVLDDGRLMDENNREVTFNNAYIILTTNAASEIYKNIAQYQESDTGDGAVMRKYDALIRRSITSATGSNRFPPELLGRIDCIVPFQPLSTKTQCDICRMRLEKVKKRLMDKHGVTMSYTEAVIDYLVKDLLTTDSDGGGARAVMNKLNTEVVAAVSEFINKNPHVQVVGVAIEGEMASENKNRLESDAHVKVGAVSVNNNRL